MKCCYCPANRNESYEYPEYYCALGVSDGQTTEFADGEYGCNRRSYDKIKSDLEKQDKIEGEAFAEMAASMVEFWKNENDAKEVKMINALEKLERHQAAQKILNWCDRMNTYLADSDKAEFWNDDGIIQLPNTYKYDNITFQE